MAGRRGVCESVWLFLIKEVVLRLRRTKAGDRRSTRIKNKSKV